MILVGLGYVVISKVIPMIELEDLDSTTQTDAATDGGVETEEVSD